MTAKLPPLVIRTLKRLVSAFDPDKVILFGSYAKNNTHDFSDVDFLVISSATGNPDFHRKRARQLSSDAYPPIDVVFASPEDIESSDKLPSPFLSSILEKGIVVYENKRRPGTVVEPLSRDGENYKQG